MAVFDLALGALVLLFATSAGALMILAIDRIDKFRYCLMLSSAAGAMFFSSLEMMEHSYQGSNLGIMLLGMFAGIVALLIIDMLLPHIHRHIKKEEITDSKKKAALIASSIALHNIPEGFAVASAFAASAPLGWVITASIALQDIPEGALVSAPLVAYGVGAQRSVFWGIFSGAVEASAAIAGYFLLSSFIQAVPLALSFCSGAMLYIVFIELLPDAIEDGMWKIAGASFIIGILAALALASVLPG